MLACFNSLQHQLLGNAVAANQLDNDVNVRVGNHGACIADHLDGWPDRSLRACCVQVSDHGDLNTPPCTANNLALVTLQHVKHAAADGANAQKAYLNRFHMLFNYQIRL